MFRKPKPLPATSAVLHVIPSDIPHADAFLIGNREGLARLRDAITAALDQPGHWCAAGVTPNDSEGYWCMVRCETEERMTEMPAFYTDDGWPESWPDGWPGFPSWWYEPIAVKINPRAARPTAAG